MSFITCDANCGPRSDTIPVGSPWCFHTWRKYSFAVSRADTLLVQGMNSTSLEKRSTTTRTLSNPSDLGRSVIKSVEISFQGPGGVSSSLNFPDGAWLDPLNRAHRSHLDTHSWPGVAVLHQFKGFLRSGVSGNRSIVM